MQPFRKCWNGEILWDITPLTLVSKPVFIIDHGVRSPSLKGMHNNSHGWNPWNKIQQGITTLKGLNNKVRSFQHTQFIIISYFPQKQSWLLEKSSNEERKTTLKYIAGTTNNVGFRAHQLNEKYLFCHLQLFNPFRVVILNGCNSMGFTHGYCCKTLSGSPSETINFTV